MALIRLDILAYPSPFKYCAPQQTATPKLIPPKILYLFSLIKVLIELNISNILRALQNSNNQYFYSKMIDFGRTFCDLHPNQLISNFCSREQCNIGLCATCICSHTEFHLQSRTAPEYQNIRNTYSKMQDSIRLRISELEQQKIRINNLVESIQNKRKGIINTICQARQDALDFVNTFFDSKEKQIMRRLEADQKKLGLHNQNRMDTLNNSISRDINTLFSAAQDLNSSNFLESFYRIRTQVLPNSLQTQKQISAELDKNQSYQTSLTVNPTYLNQLRVALEKCLQFCWEDRELPQKLQQIKEHRENTNHSSRVLLGQSQNTPISTPKRTESMPKHSFSSQTSRHSSNRVQPYMNSFFKQPTQQMSPIYQQPPYFQHEPYITNNSVSIISNHPGQTIQARPVFNYNRASQVRVNSSERNIKQNSVNKHPLAQSFMDVHFSTHNNQLEASKKVRRSGLTVLRTVGNQLKN